MGLYAFDGIRNEDEADEGKDTNVLKFFEAYVGNRFYLEGVGTRKGFIGKILGGITGAGVRIRNEEALAEYDHNAANGDS